MCLAMLSASLFSHHWHNPLAAFCQVGTHGSGLNYAFFMPNGTGLVEILAWNFHGKGCTWAGQYFSRRYEQDHTVESGYFRLVADKDHVFPGLYERRGVGSSYPRDADVEVFFPTLAETLRKIALGQAGFRRTDWTLPAGFNVETYSGDAGSAPNARSLALSGNSRLNGPVITYVSSMSFGGTLTDIYAMVDLSGRGEADYVQVIVSDLSSMPNGIAWNNGSLFIASLDPYKSCRLYRLDNVDTFALGKKAATLKDLVLIRDDLPIDRWHGWKFIRFGPDGNLYIPIGANCNICRLNGKPPNNGTLNGEFIYSGDNSQDPKRVTAPYKKCPTCPTYEFGSIYRMDKAGNNIKLVARGVRNTVGFDFHPDTKKLYFTDNGRDNWDLKNPAITDNRPDCELNYAPSEGLSFGFPYCHTGPAGNNIDARPYLRPPGVGANLVDPDENANQTVACNGPALSFKPAIQAMGPHTAPLGMRFYKWAPGANFPRAYDRSILVAQHGSWNRQRPIGARVMRITLDPSNPGKVQTYTPFLSGGVPGDKGAITGPNPQVQPREAYRGRPVDVEQLPDGSVLVSDDKSGMVYRVSYRAPTSCARSFPGGGGEGGDSLALTPTTIPGTGAGCKVNLGRGLFPHKFRRCVQAQVLSGRYMQLATSLAAVGGKLVLKGALVLPNYACLNSPRGWAGFGLPPEQGGGIDMVGGQAFITQPVTCQPGATSCTGATTAAYKLNGQAFSLFKPSSGFLASPSSLKACQAGGALVTVFEILLPYSFQLQAWKASKITSRPVRAPGDDDTPFSTVTFMMALGDVAGSTLQQHWLTAGLSIPFSLADIDAAVPPAVPVINKGAGTLVPPAKASPPPPPGPSCVLEGVAYQACQTTSDPGFPFSQFYSLNGSTLNVGIKATTSGWLAWSWNPGNLGGMIGGNALFARPCASGCSTGVSTPAFVLGGYATGLFTQPTSIVFSVLASGKSGSTIWAAFSLSWPAAGDNITINYGGGPYVGGSVDGADGMGQHGIQPPYQCISKAGGAITLPSSC
ncbi:hypothetical protein ABPG77_010555 [Micractinium sp. CCAP 211/92]